MRWIPRDDRSLVLDAGTDPERSAALDALQALTSSEDPDVCDLAHSLFGAVQAGVVQVRPLARLGQLAHGQGADRASARRASEALFGFVLPTPSVGMETDFFWRVARQIEARQPPPTEEPGRRSLRFKSFARRADAAAYGSQLGGRLVSVTESAGGQGRSSDVTLWFWEGQVD